MDLVQQILDVFGNLYPVRLGYTWLFVVAAVLGLLAGITLSFAFRRYSRWPIGAPLAAAFALVVYLVYRNFIFSHEEPAEYDGSLLQFEELGLSFIFFLLVGIAIEIALRSSIGKTIGK
jgi:hypothetical protein